MQILLVDDDELERRILVQSLAPHTHVRVDAVASGPAALDRLTTRPYDAVITDVVMQPMDGIELVRRIRRHNPVLPVVVLTASASVERAVDAMRAGATDFLPKPVNVNALLALLQHDLGEVPLREELEQLRKRRTGAHASEFIVGDHPLLDAARRFAERVASVPEARVLITGESGTGKSYLARAIHALSGSGGRFVEVSCATLPPSLIESELFASASYQRWLRKAATATTPTSVARSEATAGRRRDQRMARAIGPGRLALMAALLANRRRSAARSPLVW
jgi:two-component system response regulator HydG